LGWWSEPTLPDGLVREVICVNDCSTDGTKEKLDELPALFPGVEFKISHKPVNQGKGAALRDGSDKRAATSSSCRMPTLNMTHKTT